jgi:hypothetical protein
VIRSVRPHFRRFATCLAVAAALAFVLDGALGANHHLSAAAPGHHHAEPNSHGSHGHGPHAHSHSVDVAHDVDMPAADHDGALASAPDADANSWLNACYAAVVLPCPNTQALPYLFGEAVTAVHSRHDKGVIPDGLRKPPRPLALT